MPSAPFKPCGQVGCPTLIVSGSRCPVHQSQSTQHVYDKERGPAHLRGYDHSWKVFRSKYVKAHPLCEDCLALVPPVYTLVEEVHHSKKVVTHPELKLVESNCRSLCKPHHSKRTRAWNDHREAPLDYRHAPHLDRYRSNMGL